MELDTDVLVVGGGPAATWAALKAAEAGARVVLADKGYCGTSGATAAVGTGIWYVPPEPDAREAAMASREALGGYLADRRWMARVLDQTYKGVNEHTHPLPAGGPEHDADGLLRSGLLGSYREQIGWGRGRTPGAARAIGPALHPDNSPIIS